MNVVSGRFGRENYCVCKRCRGGERRLCEDFWQCLKRYENRGLVGRCGVFGTALRRLWPPSWGALCVFGLCFAMICVTLLLVCLVKAGCYGLLMFCWRDILCIRVRERALLSKSAARIRRQKIGRFGTPAGRCFGIQKGSQNATLGVHVSGLLRGTHGRN